MYIPFVLIVTVTVFAVQLLACFRCRTILRYAPVGCLGVAEGLLWGFFYLVKPAFSVYIIGLIGLYWLGAGCVAWLVYGIVRFVQKRRK